MVWGRGSQKILVLGDKMRFIVARAIVAGVLKQPITVAALGAVVVWLIIVLVGHILLDHVKYNSVRAENRRLIQRTNRRMSLMYAELKKNRPPCELEDFVLVPPENLQPESE
jgi:hypothetical protein